ncbi:hypothetical protein RchiOBHm_Chr6g0248191 [Rosa chinensis]|uniref:Uncharacterized protein n=1 Tax=Rosa chinensis TaxID=74649 RepID=A0A2P6PJY9_ROSCH|nr:hypothetical protein RchiOBHm_Chr6g0248191 [Rosa chinensis]
MADALADMKKDGASPSEGHPTVNLKNKPTKDVHKHPDTSKPAWLLALEVVTRTT